ncbi:MAG: TraR/DksA family transcriptional regulator [Spirochaetaceae bacterium]|nr:TraR/DksA family transcriptional regulator [Spirochaetaceae bacterium]MBQ4331342.1 TraR/DksA family transcriptional regulator [Spirochaetaceae bacterium]MBQ8384793.1 TraR/DksA family transcriptional regulator [Spirochaetaceae bacterium]MBQ8561514.1 TraR/DksA family transcriptional regulator [Spirochaetaceae bacterium]MBR2362192.1 TraR/DksA family transcriptional regulator [Spirochaetaceae bacterium]
MNQEFIDQMKEKLLAERSAIITSLAEHNADCKKILEENTGKDSIDEAADAIDLKLLESMEAKEAQQLELIEAALTRIDSGKYGYCMRCGTLIPEARLEVLPAAVLCVGCKSAAERKGR